MPINEMKITILSFLLARTSTFCWTTTLRSTSRSRLTQIPRRLIAGAMRLTRLGWTSGPLTGAMRLGMGLYRVYIFYWYIPNIYRVYTGYIPGIYRYITFIY